MEFTKKEIKSDLNRLAEMAITRILGNIPRAARRNAGRLYTTEAYRHLKGLPMLDEHISSSNQTVINWIVVEYKKYVAAVDADARRRDAAGSPASGPTEWTPEVSIRTLAEDEAGGQ